MLMAAVRVVHTLFLIIEIAHSSSNVVVYPNGTVSALGLSFNATVLYPSSNSFGVEIITSTPTVLTRCTAWLSLSFPRVNQQKIVDHFWTFETDTVVQQPNVATPIYVRDGKAEGRNHRRMIWFNDLKNSITPMWDVLCSATPLSLDELQKDPLNAFYIAPIQPHNAPVTLPVSGAGFPSDHAPKIVFVTADGMDVSVNVIQNEFVRCIAAKTLDFEAFSDIGKFWRLDSAELGSGDYGEFGIGVYNPSLSGSAMYAPRTNAREQLVIHIEALSMATRYTVGCATSVLPASKTTQKTSSRMYSAVPMYQSTRGNTEAIMSVYPNFVVANRRTLLHLETKIRGDKFYKLVGFTTKTCEAESIIAPSYLQYRASTVWVLFDMTHLTKLLICYSGDGGQSFWLQDNVNAVIDVTATSRHSIVGIVPSWSVLGKPSLFELRGRSSNSSHDEHNIVGDGWSKKIGLSLDGCKTISMDEYIERDSNQVLFTLQTFDTFEVCYSADYGQHWTLQNTRHLGVTGFATKLGASNAMLKKLKLVGVTLDRPFDPRIPSYRAALEHALRDIHIEYATFEPIAKMSVFVEGRRIAFENNYKIPIHAAHIAHRTLLEFKVMAPDQINTQKYAVSIQRKADWNEGVIQQIQPQKVLSDVETIWTLYPPIHGDGQLVRIGFVLDHKDSDCRLPQLSLAVSAYSNVKGAIEWHYFGVARYRMCYTVDGGKMWHKQSAAGAVVSVNGSYLRTPWHIATLLWVLLCLVLQVYCTRLRRLSKARNLVFV